MKRRTALAAAVIEKRLSDPEQVLRRLLCDRCTWANASMCEKYWVLVDDEDGLPEQMQMIRMMLGTVVSVPSFSAEVTDCASQAMHAMQVSA